MPRFRKKPVVIDAWQFTTGEPVPKEFLGAIQFDRYDSIYYINTLEGGMQINKGDWLVRGVEGEFYPVKASIFAATYDPVEE